MLSVEFIDFLPVQAGTRIRIRIETTIKVMEMASTTSGLTLMPRVSSSKKRSRPALEAGMGASRFLFLLLKASPDFAQLLDPS